MAHLFIRDPLVVFNETIDQDDTSSTDHFEVRPLRGKKSIIKKRLNTRIEHPIYQLANHEIQTTSAKFTDWMACGIPEHGSADY